MQHLTLDPTVEVEEENDREAAEVQVSEKFPASSNLATDSEESSVEPLRPSHRPMRPMALKQTGTVKPALRKSSSHQDLMVSAARDCLRTLCKESTMLQRKHRIVRRTPRH